MNNIDSIVINYDSQALWIMNILLGVIMFGVALDLKVEDFKKLFETPKSILVGFSAQFILLPLFTFIFVLLYEPHPSVALGMMLVAACPGGNISNFITYFGKGNTALSISLTALASMTCFVLTPVNFQIWASFYPPTQKLLQSTEIGIFDMLLLLMVILIIPLCIGMYVRTLFEEWSIKVNKILSPLSFFAFILLVIVACYNNKTHFLEYFGLVLKLVFFHNLIALIIGYSWGRIWGLDTPSVRTLTIETGIQNSGLGLAIIFSFFDGLGGMALIMAGWGVYHTISGLTIATYFRWRDRKS